MAAKKLKQKKPKKASDIYVGMLFISLVAFMGGAALLYLDYSQYSGDNPTALKGGGGGSGPASPPPGSR
jgi:hypothetical protein